MGRMQLVELEDLEWFPATIRDGATACLRVIGKVSGAGRYMAPALGAALRRTGHTRLIDLCSGGAGPLPEILEELAKEGLQVRALMTDKYPNVEALRRCVQEAGGRAEFSEEPVDALDVPRELTGMRTILNAFHHFPPGLARGILADAVRKRVPIAVCEVVEFTPWALLGVLLSPLVAMVLMPWVRPVRPAWWFFSWVVPLIPLLLLFDGLVSCRRVYSPAELLGLIDGIEDHESFDWSIERKWVWPLPMRGTTLIGTPKG